MTTYNIGPLTMEYVFKRTGLTNVSDMQAVFDAMEGGLELKNKWHREAMAELKSQMEQDNYNGW